MRFPETISQNILQCYRDPESQHKNDGIRSDNFEWSKNQPETLVEWSIRSIAQNWTVLKVSRLPLEIDNIRFLELLDTKTDLNLLVEYISDDFFWKRAFEERWDESNRESCWESKRPYIQLYLEKHLGSYLESLDPKDYDPEIISDIVQTCGNNIRNLCIRSLVAGSQRHGAESKDWAHLVREEDITETTAMFLKTRATGTQFRDHIPVGVILSGLPMLQEINISYKSSSVGENYSKGLYSLSPTDVRSLSKGIVTCSGLQKLKITRSDLDCIKLKPIIKSLAESKRIKSLDFSYCQIADDGALLLAKFIIKHPTCKELILIDNKIGLRGAEGLGYAINHQSSRLLSLNLRMNTNLRSAGCAHIATAVLRGSVLQNLNISACRINADPVEGAADCGHLIAAAIAAGKTPLRELDISVNDLGLAAGSALASVLETRGSAGPAVVKARRAGLGFWEIHVAKAALRNAAKRREAARRFRSGAARLLAAARVARAIGIVEADPVQLARHLTARPSAASAVSAFSLESMGIVLPDIVDAENLHFEVPPLKNPLPSSGESSCTTNIGTSRRSSYHGATNTPHLIQEVRKSALARKGSADSKWATKQKQEIETTRKIKIFFSDTRKVDQ